MPLKREITRKSKRERERERDREMFKGKNPEGKGSAEGVET